MGCHAHYGRLWLRVLKKSDRSGVPVSVFRRSGHFSFPPQLALPKDVEHWSLTTLREKLVKIGAKVVRLGRYITFQLAEV